jgi:hypothetical protein
MRKVTYGGAISLDGFLAGPNEETTGFATATTLRKS